MTREEIAESLKLLKGQARKSHKDTAILDVKVESFVWVIESAIQALSQEPPTFNWVQNRVDLAKAEINNAIESTFCTKDEAIGLGIALNVIDKYFTI